MTMTLWGRRNSVNVQKVLWILGELELDYEHVPLGWVHGGNRRADYLALNPNGLVPTLRDGDLVMWESHAITRYLAAEYGSGLLFPTAARERAVVDQWTDWTATTFQPAWISVFRLKVRTPLEQQDPAAIDQAVAATQHCFDILEQRLRETPYLGGDALSYANVAAGVAMHRWTTMDVARPSRPAVEAWHARLNNRPAFRTAVNVDYSELRGRLAF